MTTDPDNSSERPENGSQRPANGDTDEPKRRFDPFTHEEDMFKVVLWVGAGLLLIIVLITIARAAF